MLESGTSDDYRRLAGLHYRPGRPGTPTAIYRIVDRAPTVVGRYLGRPDRPRVVGVLVRSRPVLAGRLRDLALGGRYDELDARERAVMINREFRTISRVIIDPAWRGVGLAVRLVRHALAHPETVYTDAFASMGRVHPFFERAGMIRYDAPVRADHARLLDALRHVAIDPSLLVSGRAMRRLTGRLEPGRARWLDDEFRQWYRAARRIPRAAVDRLPVETLWRAASAWLGARPVYFLTHHTSTAGPSTFGGH